MTNEGRRVNQKEWKKDAGYGLRWMVEIIMSTFKRVSGESVRALTPRTAFIEVATKVAAYNRNPDIGDEAIREGTNRLARAYGAVAARRGKAAPAGRGDGRTQGSRPCHHTAVRSPAACGPRCGKVPDPLDRNRPDAPCRTVRASYSKTRRPETRPARVVSNCDTDYFTAYIIIIRPLTPKQ